MRTVWQEQHLLAFAEMDLNADGEITVEEFVKACLAQKKFSTIVTLKIIDLFLS